MKINHIIEEDKELVEKKRNNNLGDYEPEEKVR